MRLILKWGLRTLIALVVVAAGLGIWKREEIARLLVVNSLFEEELIVDNFSNMDRAFLHRPVPRGDGPVSELIRGPEMVMPDGFEDWLEARNVTAVIVMKDGAMVHESYHQGTSAEDLRISWSLAKSWLSLLLGTLIDDGTLPSLDVAVLDYAPELAGTAYDGASLRDVVTMMSGVAFDEDYFDYYSDINRMGRVLALGRTMDGFAASLSERRDAPGASWKYTSIDTHVIGQVIRGATGRSIADLLSERLIQNMGLEAEPYYLTDGVGVSFVLGGLNMRTRDYARMGQLVLQNGVWNGTQLVSEDWVHASIRPQAKTEPGRVQYGYQWWIEPDGHDGEVTARGIYGQYLYIDQSRGVVIAVNGADRRFRDDGIHRSNIEMFRKMSTSLQD